MKKRSSTKELQAKTVRKASRVNVAWNDDEVVRLIGGIQRDETSFEIALSLGRTYYSVINARSHVRFAMNHLSLIQGLGFK